MAFSRRSCLTTTRLVIAWQRFITMQSPQITDRVLMIRPKAFGYNPETATDNAFQSQPAAKDVKLIRERASSEFDQLSSLLTSNGIEVNVEADTDHPETPDAVFPNNWISFHSSSPSSSPTIITYPMMSPLRRKERREDIIQKWTRELAANVTDLSHFETSGKYLEGTGSMVLDRVHGVVYACISSRTNQSLVDHFCNMIGYSSITFHSYQSTAQGDVPVYHTNVMMSIGKELAIVCLESIRDETERKKVKESLQSSGRTLLNVTEQQMASFACNVLELCNKDGERFVALSTKAYNALEAEQIDIINERAKLIHCPIDTIEKSGGGGIRCMLAEIFPPKYN